MFYLLKIKKGFADENAILEHFLRLGRAVEVVGATALIGKVVFLVEQRTSN